MTVEEERVVSQRISVDSVTENEIRMWMTGAEMDEATRAKLTPLLAVSREITESRRVIGSLESQKNSIHNAQDRIRQNLSALGSSPAEAGLRQRYVSQLEEQENQLADLDSKLNSENTKLDRLQKQLSGMISSLEL